MRAVFGTMLAAVVLWAAPAAGQPAPNLEVVSVSGPAVAVAGGTLEVTATLRVHPSLSAATWTPYLTAGGVLDGALALGSYPVPVPPVGQTVLLEARVPVPTNVSGVFQLAIVLDPTNAFVESNELDNVGIAPNLTRVRAQAPDLRFTSVASRDLRLRPSDPATVDFGIENVGELAATVRVSAYLSRHIEVTTADDLVGSTDVTLAPGESTAGVVTGVVPAALAARGYLLGVIVDPLDEVAEVSETNNVLVSATPLVVYFDDLTLDTTDLPGATLGLGYHARLQVTGGDGTYAFQVVQGILPEGLTLNAVTGAVSGTPIQSGTFDFRIEVDSDGKTAGRDFSVEVVQTQAPLAIVIREVAQGFLNMPYEQVLVAGGGEPPYSWDLIEGGGVLPPGLDLSPAGLITGAPTTLGNFSFTVVVEDRLGAKDQIVLEATVTSATNVIVLTERLDPLPVGEPVDVALTAAGGVTPYDWEALSPPPPGLTLTENGRLQGTPNQVGDWDIWVQVTDGSRGEVRDSALVQVEVVDAGSFVISTTRLPNGATRRAYEVVLEASGGQAPLTWSLATGSVLPPDFFMVPGDGEDAPENTALLYGFPVIDGYYAFTVRVEDAFGRRREMTYALSVDRTFVEVSEGCRCASPGDTAPSGFGLLVGAGFLLVVARRRRR